jgi:hypothetical protein
MKRHVTNTNDFSKRLKPATIKRFCKNVSQLVVSGYKRKRYYQGFHKIMYEVMSDVNVLSTRVLNWILGNIDGTCIITIDNHGILIESIIT